MRKLINISRDTCVCVCVRARAREKEGVGSKAAEMGRICVCKKNMRSLHGDLDLPWRSKSKAAQTVVV